MATFPGPTGAIRCAQALGKVARDLGMKVRCGIHTGEVETAGRAVRGVAVHVAARVASLMEPNQIGITSTVRDLIVGSGMALTDIGSHELKGVGERRIFAVG
jgi:class 3 adenylate cyclase